VRVKTTSIEYLGSMTSAHTLYDGVNWVRIPTWSLPFIFVVSHGFLRSRQANSGIPYNHPLPILPISLPNISVTIILPSKVI